MAGLDPAIHVGPTVTMAYACILMTCYRQLLFDSASLAMHIVDSSLDDLLRRVFDVLLKSNNRIKPTKGPATEVTGVLLELSDPRARLSRTETKGTVFSCLGELCWYLAKSKELSFIGYYIPEYRHASDDKKTVFGGYGPRLFAMRDRINQFRRIEKILKKKESSRQAVIQLFDADDLSIVRKDVPCTCTMQFMIRKGKLELVANMRSNDAFLGLPHDVFCFTMLQEIMARTLDVQLGCYKHVVGSLHLYERHRSKAKQYLKEGWQSNNPMPRMPTGDPWSDIRKLLKAEQKIRGDMNYESRAHLPSYWADLIRLLSVYANQGRKKVIEQLKQQMHSDLYDTYIDKRAAMAPRKRG
jgi:thymidylate synthase